MTLNVEQQIDQVDQAVEDFKSILCQSAESTQNYA